MLKRDTEREVPDRSHYIEIEAGGRAWTFRLPPERKQIAMVRLVGSMSQDEDEADGPELVEATANRAAVLGAVLGRCWFDRGFDLESVENGDAVAFGNAVNDELYEEGYGWETSITLGAHLLRRFSVGLVGKDRVDALMGFTPPPPSDGSGGSG